MARMAWGGAKRMGVAKQGRRAWSFPKWVWLAG